MGVPSCKAASRRVIPLSVISQVSDLATRSVYAEILNTKKINSKMHLQNLEIGLKNKNLHKLPYVAL